MSGEVRFTAGLQSAAPLVSACKRRQRSWRQQPAARSVHGSAQQEIAAVHNTLWSNVTRAVGCICMCALPCGLSGRASTGTDLIGPPACAARAGLGDDAALRLWVGRRDAVPRARCHERHRLRLRALRLQKCVPALTTQLCRRRSVPRAYCHLRLATCRCPTSALGTQRACRCSERHALSRVRSRLFSVLWHLLHCRSGCRVLRCVHPQSVHVD